MFAMIAVFVMYWRPMRYFVVCVLITADIMLAMMLIIAHVELSTQYKYIGVKNGMARPSKNKSVLESCMMLVNMQRF